MNNITIKVTLESNGPSEFGDVSSTKTYAVCHLSEKYSTLSGNLDKLDAGKARAIKLISKALRSKASVLIEAEWYNYTPGGPSKTLGQMWVRAHLWGTVHDVYESSCWQADTAINYNTNKPATRKGLIKGLNNLAMTVTDTINNWESI